MSLTAQFAVTPALPALPCAASGSARLRHSRVGPALGTLPLVAPGPADPAAARPFSAAPPAGAPVRLGPGSCAPSRSALAFRFARVLFEALCPPLFPKPPRARLPAAAPRSCLLLLEFLPLSPRSFRKHSSMHLNFRSSYGVCYWEFNYLPSSLVHCLLRVGLCRPPRLPSKPGALS